MCGIIGMERGSSLDDSSTSTATTAAPQTFTGVDSTNEVRSSFLSRCLSLTHEPLD
mgnify:CR=1 FL=1